jgi:hypothetical protein
VDVIADKPGDDYNLVPGKWVIVAFQEKGDTERAEKIYGVSTEPMTGGASGPSKVVTQADYDEALARAQEEASAKLKQSFDAQAAGMRVLEEATVTWAPVEASARPDDAAASVSVTMEGSLKTVAFRQSDLEQLVAEVVLAKERLVVVPDQLEMAFSDVAFKEDLGTLSFSVTVTGPGYEPLDTEAITADIKGMNGVQIREYFATADGVESATVELSPFWVRKVPKKDARITVEIRYERPVSAQ